jgi:HAMP domain-containing protein
LVLALSTTCVALAGVTLLASVAGIARDATSRESTAALSPLGREVAERVGRELHRYLRETEVLVQFAQASTDMNDLRLRFETTAQLNSSYAWIGFARPDGRVIAATGKSLEGERVADQSWFRAGLQRPSASDLREPALLRELRHSVGTEPIRLFDIAAPVRRADGTVAGVVSSHVSWAGVREAVRGGLHSGGRDAMLVSRTGVILAGPPELEGEQLDLPSVHAARQGVATSGLVETWPDGQSYVTAVVAPISFGALPSLGWSLVVRQKVVDAAAPARAITRRLALGLAVAGFIAITGTLVIGWIVARPLRRLTETVVMLAEGELNEMPLHSGAYREIGILSQALKHLQAQLERRSREATRTHALPPLEYLGRVLPDRPTMPRTGRIQPALNSQSTQETASAAHQVVEAKLREREPAFLGTGQVC